MIAGSRAVSMLPLGSLTTVNMSADWPHPSFQGAFLPVERKIDDAGFQARWQVLELNRSYGQAWYENGLALSMFYLLLTALSEHIAFALAYITAAAALVLLIGLYLAGALHSTRRGVIADGAMTLVYGLLYMLVLSEDYSLLLGSIILFAALAAVMLATRRVDWYRLRPEEPSRTEESYR